MPQPDFRGARGSNAGDDFHELWALRQALALLDQQTELIGITVEGLGGEDEKGSPSETWDGVDCALYFNGDSVDHAQRIELIQCKYSSADPHKKWTASRLVSSTAKKGNNSVLHQMSAAFEGVRQKRGGSAEGIVVRLISNQPIDPGLVALFAAVAAGANPTNSALENVEKLKKATGLKRDDFKRFASAVQMSQEGSRFGLEENILRKIASWEEGDARSILNDLLAFMGRMMMMPESKGSFITQETLLLQLGFSERRALFPCLPPLSSVKNLIPRGTSSRVIEEMLIGHKYICMHGLAGCGKTTALEEIRKLLPAGSGMILFDCYGGGRYQDSDAYRHRPKDAFLQLSNEMAVGLRVPLLLTRKDHTDYARAFKSRLVAAAETVKASATRALLVIAVDAADNSVTAAQQMVPLERSFAQDFVSLVDLPQNVRLIVTARSGHLAQLDLPHHFKKLEIDGFTRDETAAHVRSVWANAPDTFVDDFHDFSQGNPRFQNYALARHTTQPQDALNILLPGGGTLTDVFQLQLDEAFKKAGKDGPLNSFLAALVVLPHPAPVAELSAITHLTEIEIRDICAALVPGIRIAEDGVGFADEDFEQFIRTNSLPELGPVRAHVAERFAHRHRDDQYAATHLAAALYAAGRGTEILDLIEKEAQASAILDPILRREVGFQRLQIAMQVSSEANDHSSMLRTILVGAEAMRGEEAVLELITNHPDLAAAFMRESAVRKLLHDARRISQHGRLLFHLVLEDARAGNHIGARATRRQLNAWLQKRGVELDWPITPDDIAADVEAVLLLEGPHAAIKRLRGWIPRDARIKAARIVVQRLVSSGRAQFVEACLSERLLRDPWSVFLLVPLALAGRRIDLKRLEHALRQIHGRGWIRLEKLDDYQENDLTSFWLDTILTGCEILVARGGDRKLVTSLLEVFSDKTHRQIGNLYTFRTSLMDIQLRAVALLLRFEGRSLKLGEFLIIPEAQGTDGAVNTREIDDRHAEELRRFMSPLMGMYDARAQLLVKDVSPTETSQILATVGRTLNDYDFSRIHDSFEMRRKAAVAVAYLRCVSSIDSSELLGHSLNIFGERPGHFGADELSVLPVFASDSTLHNQILKAAAKRVEDIVTARTVASEKSEALLKISAFVANINRDEAVALFSKAHSMSEEIDVEAIHQIRATASMAIRAAPALDTDQRRQVCQHFHSIVTDASVRLSDQQGFPWGPVVEALAHLDLPMALACISRWQDSNTNSLDSTLPALIRVGLGEEVLPLRTAVAILPLLLYRNRDMFHAILSRLTGLPAGERRVTIEELAREELLCFGAGHDPTIAHILSQCCSPHEPPGPWLRSLEQTAAFLQRDVKMIGSGRPNQERSGFSSPSSRAAQLPAGIKFITSEEIVNTFKHEVASARSAQHFISTTDLFDRIRMAVTAADRIPHLTALAAIRSDDVPEYIIAEAICRAVEDSEWKHLASVREWCGRSLPDVIIDLFPGFLRGLGDGERPLLPPLLTLLSNEGICIPTLLAKAIGAHVEKLSATVVYELVRLIAERMQPNHTAGALIRHLERMRQRIPMADLDRIDFGDVPVSNSEAVARLLFSLMSDCDLRVRWRAAHSVRRLAKFSLTEPFDAFVSLYDRTSEESFRAANEPFYWQAARLGDVIALNRIAYETPTAITGQYSKLLSIATDDSFPHVLVRAFAKDAASHLLDFGAIKLGAKARKSLVTANTGSLPRVKGVRRHLPSEVSEDKRKRDRAFQFDPLDTIPYWYRQTTDIFADVALDEFLDVAESWIIDKWKTTDESTRWSSEPRKYRFSELNWTLSNHGHGSRPTLERFRTYLERHAMFCAVGELMQSRSLLQARDDNYDSLEGWLKREGLSSPPNWLADLRGPKPLEPQFWSEPQNVSTWLEAASDADFVSELGIGAGCAGMIIAKASHETGSAQFSSTVRVDSALVATEVAAALMRALQSVRNTYDYGLPYEGGPLQIDPPPYRLLGWLSDASSDSGIDYKDLLRRSITGVRFAPGSDLESALVRSVSHDGTVTWRTPGGSVAFEHVSWSDKDDEETSDRRSKSLESEGQRLWVSTEALHCHMLEMRMDLIVSIEFTREEGDGGYQKDDNKKKTVRKAKVILLREDGGIEDCNGRIGTWQEPRNRAKTRRTTRHPRPLASPPRR